jgi:hypothetical protein
MEANYNNRTEMSTLGQAADKLRLPACRQAYSEIRIIPEPLEAERKGVNF